MDQCEICGATVFELRRGRCWGCYTRWVDARPVGLGAACRMCGDRRRGVLKSMELLGCWVAVCHNCSARIAGLSPLPQTMAGIEEALGRERRARAETRVAHADRRSWSVRGTGAVEAAVDRTTAPIDDAMILDIVELAGDLEALAGDLTRIRPAPTR